MPVGPRGKWAIKRPSITKTRVTTYALVKNVRIVDDIRARSADCDQA